MLEKIKNGADAAIDVGIKLISLSIVLQLSLVRRLPS